MPENSQIAVVGIVVHNGKCLFLRRNVSLYHWCPPCGRVHVGEEVVTGLRREIKEEAGLDVEVIVPVETWTGEHRDGDLLSITYVCHTDSEDVILSEEHSEYRWVAINELNTMSSHTDFDLSKWPTFISFAQTIRSQT